MSTMESKKWFRTAGILEWIICFVGVGYVWAFTGFLRCVFMCYLEDEISWDGVVVG